MAHSYHKNRVQSKADLSVNWREPLPAAPPKPVARGPVARAKDAFRPPPKGFSVFHKKPALVNPYPPQPYVWYDLPEYSPSMHCEICKTTVRKSIFPQVLDVCGHIFCAKCIHEHHIVAGKKQCPTCAAFIRRGGAPGYCGECCDAPCSCRDDYDGCPDCDCGRDGCDSYYDDPDDDPNNDGELGCGCIDVCRGRCDSYYGGW